MENKNKFKAPIAFCKMLFVKKHPFIKNCLTIIV